MKNRKPTASLVKSMLGSVRLAFVVFALSSIMSFIYDAFSGLTVNFMINLHNGLKVMVVYGVIVAVLLVVYSLLRTCDIVRQ